MKNRVLSVSEVTHLTSQVSSNAFKEAFNIHKMERRSLVDELTPILIKETINSGVLSQRGCHEH